MPKKMSWDDFEPVREDATLDEAMTDEMTQAIERIGKTEDGAYLKRWLLGSMTRLCREPGNPVRLSEQHGERRFARMLFNRLNGTGHERRNAKRRAGNTGGDA